MDVTHPNKASFELNEATESCSKAFTGIACSFLLWALAKIVLDHMHQLCMALYH